MGLLEEMKQADEQQSTSEMLTALTSQLDAQASQLSKLTKAVNELSGYVKVMDEVHTAKLKALTSQQPEQPSTLQLGDETRKRLSEIEKTLAALAKTLSDERVVKLPSGERVSASQLDSLKLTREISEKLETMAQSSVELAKAVKTRGRIVIDPDKLAEHAVKVLDQRLAKALEPSVARVEQTLAGFETKVADVGLQRVAEASKEVEKVTGKADAVVAAVRAAEARVEALEGRATWTAVGRLCLALLPLAAMILVIGGLLGGVAYAAGLGPLLGWAWTSFAAAQAWWAKALIALGTLSGVAGFVALVWWLAKRLGEDFRHW
jgi:hypothetical protein blinB_05184